MAKKKKILLIEDDPDQQKMYLFAFEKAGHRLLQATNGKDGVATAHKEKPDVILLDMLMNGIDGIETLKLLRKDEVVDDTIPVVIFTNFTKDELLDQARSLGASEVIIKTEMVPHDLVRHIEETYLR